MRLVENEIFSDFMSGGVLHSVGLIDNMTVVVTADDDDDARVPFYEGKLKTLHSCHC